MSIATYTGSRTLSRNRPVRQTGRDNAIGAETTTDAFGFDNHNRLDAYTNTATGATWQYDCALGALERWGAALLATGNPAGLYFVVTGVSGMMGENDPDWDFMHQGHVAVCGENAAPYTEGGEAVVVSVGVERAPESERFESYNFEVAEWHTYFVGSKDMSTIWVHNDCKPKLPQVRALREMGISRTGRRAFFQGKMVALEMNFAEGSVSGELALEGRTLGSAVLLVKANELGGSSGLRLLARFTTLTTLEVFAESFHVR